MAPKQDSSESLLTEILRIVQDLNKNVNSFKAESKQIKKEIRDLSSRLDVIVSQAFVGGDLPRHQRAHSSWWHFNKK